MLQSQFCVVSHKMTIMFDMVVKNKIKNVLQYITSSKSALKNICKIDRSHKNKVHIPSCHTNEYDNITFLL